MLLNSLQIFQSLRDNAHKQTYSPYKQARKDFVDYLDEIFSIHLKNPTKVAGFEIFCFHDIKLVNRQIKGSLRAAIESALKDPKTSLQVWIYSSEKFSFLCT